MVEFETNGRVRLIRYWPFGAAGFVGPILANVLTRWVPLHYAVGCSGFVVCLAAVSLFQRTSARPGMGMLGKLITSTGTGLVAGLLALLFPWK